MPAPPKPLTREQVISDIKDLGRVPMGLLDILAGAAKGSVSATAGLPGDIESLVRMIPGLERKAPRETFLPTSEEVSKALPPVIPAGASPQRQASAQFGQDVGAFIPPPVSALGQATAQAGKTIGRGALQAAKVAPRIPGAVLDVALSGPTPGSRAAQLGAIKMKGGNWLAGEVEGATEPLKKKVASPEDKQRIIDRIEASKQAGFAPDIDVQVLNSINTNEVLNNWIDKKLNRYIKNEMATPDDPVRKLAEQGILHYQPRTGQLLEANANLRRSGEGEQFGVSPLARAWEDTADISIIPSRAEDFQASTSGFIKRQNPWIEKVSPETKIYEATSAAPQDLGFDHLIDELKNAIDPNSDLPARLRWKPEDLEKVTMEQAVRRVHDINEYRAAKKAEANEVLARNPATVTFKEYPTVPGSDKPNEKGLAWKEIRQPELTAESLPARYEIREMPNKSGGTYFSIRDKEDRGLEIGAGQTAEAAVKNAGKRIEDTSLRDALKYEGDVMGHCVGGYCDDVLSGRSQIYSLRDKKGEPHVTIEVRPNRAFLKPLDFAESAPPSLRERINEADAVKRVNTQAEYEELVRNSPEYQEYLSRTKPQEIIQIKGKGNAAPKAEYLPFVQDFVRGGNWSRVGDIKNTGLEDIGNYKESVRAAAEKAYPGQRFLTLEQIQPLVNAASEKKMKSGGSVRISDNPDTMRLELAGGGAVAAAKAAAKAAKAAKEVPPPLPRAPAKTKAEIEAIAERIAPQLMGEYVRKSPESAITTAGKTKKQFEREKDLPVELTGEARTPTPLDIESLKGKTLIGIMGDPSITGRELKSVGDIQLESAAPQHGGPLYGMGQDEDIFWASGKGAAKKVQNLAEEVSKQYGADVLGKYIMMGPEGLNYAQHFADANLQAIDLSKMTKRQVEQFNNLIRKGSPNSGPRPTFPGIEDKESAYLHFAMDPKLRIHFNSLMQMPTVTEAFNLPSGQDIRYAITEPLLRDLERGVAGMSIGEMRPGRELTRSMHPTYEMDIPGKFIGSSKYPTPYELMFPDTVKSIRENPAQALQEFGSLGMVGPRQVIDQQMIDEIKAYEERIKRLTGKKKGGAVKKQAGGAIKAAAKAAERAAKAAKPEVLTAAERDANLAKMLEQSAVKERLYHGSKNPNITQFKTGQMIKEEHYPGNTIEPWATDNRGAVFLTPDPNFSGRYSGGDWEIGLGYSPTTYPVHVQVKNPWDYENPEHIERAIKAYKEKFPLQRDPSGGVPSHESMRHHFFEQKLRELPLRERDNWSGIESADLQNIIKELGHDAFFVKEAGVKNLGVYEPSKIKSATGNRGTFDVTNPDITKKRGGKVSITNNLDTMRLAVQKRK